MDYREVFKLCQEGGEHLVVFIGRRFFLFSCGALYPFMIHIFYAKQMAKTTVEECTERLERIKFVSSNVNSPKSYLGV